MVCGVFLLTDYPNVAVMMPCYNEEKWIAKAIDSVMNQDYEGNIILFIANDGSTDKSEEVIRQKMTEKYDKRAIKLINRAENKGIGFTLNEIRKTILEYKSVEFVRWLSADDMMYKDNVSIMIESQKESGAKFLYSDWTMINEGGSVVREYILSQYNTHDDFCVALFANCCVNGSTMLVHREVLEKIPFDESFRYGEDWLFFLMCARDYTFAHEVTPTVFYRTHKGQTTQDKMSDIPANNALIIEKARMYWDSKKKDDVYMVNWLNTVNGGVESIFEDIRKGIGGKSTISINNAYTTLGIPFPHNGSYYRHAVFDRSFVLAEFIKNHNEIFKPDFYICNDDTCAFSEIKNRIMIFQNPYIDISTFLYANHITDIQHYIEYNKMYPLMQKQGSVDSLCNVAVSEYMKEVMGRMNITCDKVIPHGVDISTFKPLSKEVCRKKFGIETDKPVAVISTKFLPLKYFLIPELVKAFPDIYWVINFASAIDYQPKLDNVKIVQPLPREMMAEFYNCGDFGVFPSAIESFNLSAVECMACDVPIIVTNTGYFYKNDKAVIFGVPQFVDAIKGRKYVDDHPRTWVFENGLVLDRMIRDYKTLLDELRKSTSSDGHACIKIED